MGSKSSSLHLAKWLNAGLVFGLTLISNVGQASTIEEVQAIFDVSCVSCHSGADPSDGLSLDDADTSQAQLIDVDATCTGLPNQKRVVPGEPENSVLFLKVNEANPDCDNMMPRNGPMLNASDRNTIYNWILSLGPAGTFGLIQVAQTNVDVQEDDLTFSLMVNRTLASQGSVSVDYDLINGTAASPEDFVAQSGTLIFADGESSKTIVVTLVNDDVVENSESFSLQTSNVSGGAVLGGDTQTQINLADDDSPGTLLFSRINYSVNEIEPQLSVTVLRSFGSAGEIRVDLASIDGSATAANDYQALNETLVFSSGERTKTINVIMIDDLLEESTENFNLRLSNPTNGAQLGSPNLVNINLIDDDSPPVDPVVPGDGDDGNNGDGGDGGLEPGQEAEYTAAGSLNLLVVTLLIVLLSLGQKRQSAAA